MKKFLTILCVGCVLGMANGVCACEGDVITDRYDSSKQYCRSKYIMNWWSAYQWCQSQGYVLAPPESCNYASGQNMNHWQNMGCSNINLSNDYTCWLNHINSDGKALHFFSWGSLSYSALTYAYGYLAICKM